MATRLQEAAIESAGHKMPSGQRGGAQPNPPRYWEKETRASLKKQVVRAWHTRTESCLLMAEGRGSPRWDVGLCLPDRGKIRSVGVARQAADASKAGGAG